ncbi:MAG: NfeD family protein [Bacteroidaceae bacterium]|nr:NfeD family protein [Bacteroidaceae bacterium]
MTLDIIIIIALIIVALVLMVIEMLLIPGFGIAGLGAIGAFGYANYYAFTEIGNLAGFITLTSTLFLAIVIIVFVLRSRSMDKLALNKNIDSTVANEASKAVRVGDTGVTITRLALIGNALINDSIIEVRSCDGFLDENTPIIVERIVENVIMVKKHS